MKRNKTGGTMKSMMLGITINGVTVKKDRNQNNMNMRPKEGGKGFDFKLIYYDLLKLCQVE